MKKRLYTQPMDFNNYNNLNLKKMRQLLLIVFFTSSLSLFGQGNLEFNQVLTPNLTISGSVVVSNSSASVLTSSSITVPNGKVWKIESIFPVYNNFMCASCTGSGGSSILANPDLTMHLNGNKIRSNFLNEEIIKNNAIWLKSGDVITFKFTGGGGWTGSFSNGLISINFSILEFNVIP